MQGVVRKLRKGVPRLLGPLAFALCLGHVLTPASAQDLGAMARAMEEGSSITDARRGIGLSLSLSQAVPWRLRLLEGPPRLMVELRNTALSALSPRAMIQTGRVLNLTTGTTTPGWSALTLFLDRPYEIAQAEMRTDDSSGTADLALRLRATDQATFATLVQPDPSAGQTAQAPSRGGMEDLIVVALDPGHGGFDPGAENGGYSEAVLMLTFARELREKLLRRGGFDVVLTRNADIFVPLPERVAIARRAGADVMLSLHADALQKGRATGATVYTLSQNASDEVSALLAEQHSREDLLAGVDMGQAGDAVAVALMDLARRETRPRSEALADHLVENISFALGGMHKRPRLAADFAVLRAPDIPAALVEMGFISDVVDLENLLTPAWRDQAAEGIVAALESWVVEDAALSELMRQ